MSGQTAGSQWLERSLDDSAIRRMIIPEAFLCTDAILDICSNIINGIVVWPHVVQQNILQELPFMATENIIMEAVKKGGNRQELHEVIRVESMEAAKAQKAEGKSNDLIDRMKGSKEIGKYLTPQDIDRLIEPSDFVGRAPEQIREFIIEVIDPLLKEKASVLNAESSHDLSV